MRVLLTGGGTAGHINPALAIADIVKQNIPSAEILFVGIRGGKEEDLVPREGYTLRYVKARGIDRSIFTLGNVKAIWLAAKEPYSKQTTSILDEFKPDIVIGTGGYACWPIMSAAARRKIPTALHESNALPGLAIRMLQKKVDRVWINFEKTASLLKVKDRVVRVGNPLRSAFGSLSYQEARARLGIGQEQTLVLSFGGSLGAEQLNRAAVEMMDAITESDRSVIYMHATGKLGYQATKEKFESLKLDRRAGCVLTDYIYDMPLRMAAADIVISRAGAMTLSELARLGKAAILIPSPNVVDNHQFLNAKTLADAGAAILVEESELASGALTQAVCALLREPKQRQALQAQIGSFAGPDANRIIYSEILHLTKKREIK